MDFEQTTSVTSFWGPPTSYLNFCEEDYIVTRFVAEFINTLSSLTFVVYGLYGLFSKSQRHAVGPRLVSYCGLIGVGVCSASYHMTLKYHTQMSDELSMHLLTTPLVYRLLSFNLNIQQTKILRVIIISLFAIVMITHMVMDEFLLHASTFGLQIYIIVTRIRKIIPQQVPDPAIRRRLRKSTMFGCLSFGLGYIVWLLDDWVCGMLIDLRHSVGLPWAFLLELHGWWHVLTAIGGYIGVVVVDLLTSGEILNDPTHLLAWPVPLAVKFMP